MANNYYDATGVLMLDQITPVIRALFGGFNLDTSHPVNGRAYIARSSEGNNPQWSDVELDLIALCASMDLPAPIDGDEDESAMTVVIDRLATYFGVESNAQLLNLITNYPFEESADLEVLFLLATCFDDGHGLKAIAWEGCWHCSKMRLFEFGGEGQFISREISLFATSQEARTLGQSLRDAVLIGDAKRSASLIFGVLQRHLDSIQDSTMRELVCHQIASRFLSNTPREGSA